MKKQVDGQLSFLDFFEETKFISEYPQFKECDICWCYDCRHNENNEAVERDFAGVMKPCPSCSFCLQSGKAEICEIGSSQFGCRLRAEEEGITEEENR